MLQALFTENRDLGDITTVPGIGAVVTLLFDIMGDGGSSENMYVAACNATVAVNSHCLELETNMVMQSLCSHADAQYFGEALLHILNQQGFPYDNIDELNHVLKVLVGRWIVLLECGLPYQPACPLVRPPARPPARSPARPPARPLACLPANLPTDLPTNHPTNLSLDQDVPAHLTALGCMRGTLTALQHTLTALGCMMLQVRGTLTALQPTL
jgi:hypothetical protein